MASCFRNRLALPQTPTPPQLSDSIPKMVTLGIQIAAVPLGPPALPRGRHLAQNVLWIDQCTCLRHVNPFRALRHNACAPVSCMLTSDLYPAFREGPRGGLHCQQLIGWTEVHISNPQTVVPLLRHGLLVGPLDSHLITKGGVWRGRSGETRGGSKDRRVH